MRAATLSSCNDTGTKRHGSQITEHRTNTHTRARARVHTYTRTHHHPQQHATCQRFVPAALPPARRRSRAARTRPKALPQAMPAPAAQTTKLKPLRAKTGQIGALADGRTPTERADARPRRDASHDTTDLVRRLGSIDRPRHGRRRARQRRCERELERGAHRLALRAHLRSGPRTRHAPVVQTTMYRC
jgi:hypothetical protein